MSEPLLSMVSLFSNDLDRTVSFYGKVLGIEEVPYLASEIFRALSLGEGQPMLAFHAPAAQDILGVSRAGENAVSAILTFEAESVSALDAQLILAKELGASVVKEPYDTAYGHYQVILGDPDGNVFRLSVAREG